MNRLRLIAPIALFIASGAVAQSDEEFLEALQTLATKIFLEQASSALPESFHNSDLSSSDKERITLQLASDTGTCYADSAVEYASLNDIPLSDFVSTEGLIRIDGESGKEFVQLLESCVSRAWQAAGVSRK